MPAGMTRTLRILLTGGSGLLGGEVAGRLLDRGYRVTALVNRRRTLQRNDGTPLAGSALALLPGDVTLPGFGLEPAALAGHDLLIHCAAATGFDLPDATYRAVNVEGAAHAAAVARAGGMGLLHVSTAYVCGAWDGEVPEAHATGLGPFANGYEASKAAGEAAVRASGVPAAITRPGIIVGDWRTGAVGSFDTLYAAFKLIAEGRVRTVPVRAGATLDFTPIDDVAAQLVALAERFEAAQGQVFHLVSGAPVPIAGFRDAIASFPHFRAPDYVECDVFDPAALPPLERRLHKRITGLYAAYFQRSPRFRDERARALTGIACPPVDAAYLRRLIAFAIDAGFLAAAPVAAE
jgi:2-alkyl-3-oxoalkanoate reductase